MQATPAGGSITRDNRWATLITSVAVFPLPGPASTAVFPDSSTATFCSAFKRSNSRPRSSIAVCHNFYDAFDPLGYVCGWVLLSDLARKPLSEPPFANSLNPHEHFFTAFNTAVDCCIH